MRRISISELSSSRWSFYQDVIRYASAGYASMGVWRQKIDDCDVLEAADFLHEMQMSVSSVQWAGGFTGGNGISYNDAIKDAIEAIELTSRLAGGCLIVHPGCRNMHTDSHARWLFSSALRKLVPIAADYGVKLAIEPMPCRSASAWTFLKTLDCSLNLLDDFSDTDVGLVLDMYHIGLNADLFENLDRFSERVALVQLSDRKIQCSFPERRLPLGTGSIPFEKWFQRLQELGYRGQYEIELHGVGMADVKYDQMLDQSANFLKNNIEEVLFDNAENALDSARVRRPSN